MQDDSNIPLNNVVLAIFAALAAIAVQWHWANYSGMNFIRNPNPVSAAAYSAIDQSEIPEPIGATDRDGMYEFDRKGQMGRANSMQMDKLPPEEFKRTKSFSAFQINNFLTVATQKMEQQVQERKMAGMGYTTSQIQQLRTGAPFANEHYYSGIKVFFLENVSMLSTSDMRVRSAKCTSTLYKTSNMPSPRH